MSAEPAARRSHEGFLSKRSPKAGGGWQKRWFVLDGPAATLSYFKEKDARTLFDELDADNSGFLDSGEVEALCRQMGKKLGKKELAKASKIPRGTRTSSGKIAKELKRATTCSRSAPS